MWQSQKRRPVCAHHFARACVWLCQGIRACTKCQLGHADAQVRTQCMNSLVTSDASLTAVSEPPLLCPRILVQCYAAWVWQKHGRLRHRQRRGRMEMAPRQLSLKQAACIFKQPIEATDCPVQSSLLPLPLSLLSAVLLWTRQQAKAHKRRSC